MRVRRHRVAVLLIGMTLVVAACGDDAGGDTTSAGATATTAAAAATTQAPATTSAPTTEAPTTTEAAASTTTAAGQGLTGLEIISVGFDASFDGVSQPGWVIIRNFSDETISLDGYFLCQRPSYFALPDVELAPGEQLVIASQTLESLDSFAEAEANGALGTLANDSGEMGLYSSGNFGDPSAIVSYVEWGQTGHGRSSVAVSAGIWDDGEFVPTDTVEFPGAVGLDVSDPDNPVWDVIEAP